MPPSPGEKSPRRLPTWLTLPLVWIALPVAWRWARRQERRILREGRALTAAESADACRAGVTRPEGVRVLAVDTVPTPGAVLLRGLARISRFPLDPPAGMALGRGIYLDRRVEAHRGLLVHECVHVAQYERMGGIRPFLRRYLEECLRDSYRESAMEAEAHAVAARVCRSEDRTQATNDSQKGTGGGTKAAHW